jgi:putative tricarboxylic transport membrane protein
MSRQKEIVSSLVVILFGCAFLAYSTRYPIDTWENPGPAVFPLIVGVILTLLAAGQLVRSLWKGERHVSRGGKGHRRTRWAWLKRGENGFTALAMIGLFVLYLLAIQGLGFFASTFCFAVLTSRLAGARDLLKPVGLAAGLTLGCYLLFEVWLKISFPRGVAF